MNLAKEWYVTAKESGIVNKYSIDISDLKILNLQDLGVIDWLVILMNHRVVKFYNIVSETIDEWFENGKKCMWIQ